ncbi:MAG: acetyl-CoA carboxylase biotin carboxyl carrier protein [Acidobacteria bacterium]|jgi:acetyl-CoA carboxylase biotin carboxyl carrier protein|nr:MAG: acetyl-CoA carboxylase biotin carboxyl carrier protein [Acidobacteriota bacterium]
MKNQDEIKEILEMMRQHELTEFELERGDLKIRIKKSGAIASVPVIAVTQPAVPQATLPASSGSQQSAKPARDADEPGAIDGIELAVVKSPIVGTFYRASEPGAPNFVEVGDTVRKGQVLCIIEAMKLMNEIESEYDGEVANVYVDNGLPVQYGERLFAIRVK